MEYVWKTKIDGKDNVRTGKCVSLLEGGSWTSLVNSLLVWKGARGKSNQTLEGGTYDSNWSAKTLATNQHGLGG
jgi:hypothetical protein